MIKDAIKVCLGVLVFMAVVCVLVNCNPDPDPVENPEPVLNSISPDSKVAHLPAFTLTVTGSDFIETSGIVFNGVEKTTAFVSSTELNCTINPEDIVGVAPSPQLGGGPGSSLTDTTVPVLVRTPAPGGGDSSTRMFTIRSDFAFTTSTAIPMGALPADDPVMAVAGDGSVSLLYRSNAGGNETETVDFIRSTDGGSSWSTPVTAVGAHPDRMFGFREPSLSVDGDGNLHAMLLEDVGGLDLSYCYSADNGAGWSTTTYVSGDVDGANMGRLMVTDPFDGINFLILKQDVEGHYPVWFKHSTDFGATFDIFTDVWIGWETSYDYTFAPDMVVDNDHGVFVSFSGTAYSGGSRYSAVYYNYSHDSGATWNTVDTVIGPGRWSALAVVPDGDAHLFVLPSPYNDSGNYITHYHSADRGVTWAAGVNLTPPGSGESQLRAATDAAGNINLLYQRGTAYYFRRSIDNGVTWLDEIQVIPDATGLERGKIQTDDAGNLYFIIYTSATGSPVYLVTGL